MSLAVECPLCEKSLRLKPKYAGKRIKCPECGGPVQVPDEAAAPGPAKAPAPRRAGKLGSKRSKLRPPSKRAAPPPPADEDEPDEGGDDAPPRARKRPGARRPARRRAVPRTTNSGSGWFSTRLKIRLGIAVIAIIIGGISALFDSSGSGGGNRNNGSGDANAVQRARERFLQVGEGTTRAALLATFADLEPIEFPADEAGPAELQFQVFDATGTDARSKMLVFYLEADRVIASDWLSWQEYQQE